MSDEIIVENCSPTLAGIKTGNLFTCEYDSIDETQNDIKLLNKRLSPKGMRIIPMRYMKERVLLYLYRPSYLQADLMKAEVNEILDGMGYNCMNPDQCISKLISKIQSSQEFPHEIGLFLGYPAEDVRGFIENKALNYKLVGTWKVYGDEEKAKKTFIKFKKCTSCFTKQWHSGRTIEQLSAAV